jgi:ethanolamine ammonia-lyase large subunit
MGKPILACSGRVKLAEEIADKLGVELVIHLIGERPGGDARAACSLSAYLVYRLSDGPIKARAAAFSKNPDIRFETTVISNIYPEGLPPIEAGSVVAERALSILSREAAGNRLEALLKGGAPSPSKR